MDFHLTSIQPMMEVSCVFSVVDRMEIASPPLGLIGLFTTTVWLKNISSQFSLILSFFSAIKETSNCFIGTDFYIASNSYYLTKGFVVLFILAYSVLSGQHFVFLQQRTLLCTIGHWFTFNKTNRFQLFSFCCMKITLK